MNSFHSFHLSFLQRDIFLTLLLESSSSTTVSQINWHPPVDGWDFLDPTTNLDFLIQKTNLVCSRYCQCYQVMVITCWLTEIKNVYILLLSWLSNDPSTLFDSHFWLHARIFIYLPYFFSKFELSTLSLLTIKE